MHYQDLLNGEFSETRDFLVVVVFSYKVSQSYIYKTTKTSYILGQREYDFYSLMGFSSFTITYLHYTCPCKHETSHS